MFQLFVLLSGVHSIFLKALSSLSRYSGASTSEDCHSLKFTVNMHKHSLFQSGEKLRATHV